MKLFIIFVIIAYANARYFSEDAPESEVDREIIEEELMDYFRAERNQEYGKTTSKPSSKPSAKPASIPTSKPSSKPSSKLIAKSSAKPFTKPSAKQSAKPSAKPSAKTSAKPSSKPSAKTSAKPTAKPKATITQNRKDELINKLSTTHAPETINKELVVKLVTKKFNELFEVKKAEIFLEIEKFKEQLMSKVDTKIETEKEENGSKGDPTTSHNSTLPSVEPKVAKSKLEKKLGEIVRKFIKETLNRQMSAISEQIEQFEHDIMKKVDEKINQATKKI